MIKKIIFFLKILLCISMISCDNGSSSNDSNNTNDPFDVGSKTTIGSISELESKIWYRSQEYEYYDSLISNVEIYEYKHEYDAAFDDFFNAQFLCFKDNKLYSTYYYDGIEESSMMIQSYEDGVLIVYKDDGNTEMLYDTFNIYLQDDKFVTNEELLSSAKGIKGQKTKYYTLYTDSFALPIWYSGISIDSYEDDEKIDSMVIYADSKYQPIHTLSKDDIDLYRIDLDSGVSYYLQIYSEFDFSVKIYINGENDNLSLKQLNDIEMYQLGISDKTYLFECQSSDRYKIILESFYGETEGSYKLKVSKL